MRLSVTDDDGLSAFLRVRPRLYGIAYRMLRSAAEAEDIVQDVWIRWQTADRSLVRDAAAFLATTTTRLAINVMQSARSRRETCVEPWLPEPVDTSADPGMEAERGEALELGVRVLLKKLSPTERAAYILREAFDYSYREIANVLRLEEANARQVVTRARQHVADGRRTLADASGHSRLLEAFMRAAQDGDVAGLEGILASEPLQQGRHGRRMRYRHNASAYPVNGCGGTAMKLIAALTLSLSLAGSTLMAQDASVRSLFSMDLARMPGRELSTDRGRVPARSRRPGAYPSCAGPGLRAGGLDRDAGQRRDTRHVDAGPDLL